MSVPRPSPLMAIVVLVAALAFAVGPWLVPGFGGFEPAQFPVPQDNPPVQPAGYAFAIWGLIYLWLLVSAGFGVIARARAVDWQPMRPALALSLAVGAAWLPVAKTSPLAATLLIWVMLLSALSAMARSPFLDHWLARAPVALYAGWLTAASSVALGLMLSGYGVLGPQTAALFSLVLAFVIASVVLSLVRDVAEFGAGVAWALAGIAVTNAESQGPVLWLALGAAVLIGFFALRSATR